ncbi:MAG: hypothetical protein GY774_04475 [Planctomycetes bacterium]|nr:hypothetical protein [Planctomycetota bacterium]
MINYQLNPQFSLYRSQKRLEKAKHFLGQAVVYKILAFALYLLGANVKALANFLKMPHDTIKSLIDRITKQGLPALADRRRKTSIFAPQPRTTAEKPELTVEAETLTLHFNRKWEMQIPLRNKFQCRTVLLSMLAAGLLTKEAVAKALQLSTERTRKLKTALFKNDVNALIDQRRGQKKDYRMTSEVKAELIQQFVLNLSSETSTSSEQLSNDLSQRCEFDLVPRTIRLHVARLGLKHLKSSLASLLHSVKKNSNA